MMVAAHTRSMLASAAVHATVLALLLALPPVRTAVSRSAPVAAVEVNFDTPPQAPTTPIARPTTPIARPTTPIARPTTPIARPTTPIARPTAPIARPTAPVARPTTPVARPTTPPPSLEPPAPAPTPPAPVLRAADLLRASRATVDSSFAMPSAAPAQPALFAGSTGTAEGRLRAATQGYVREALAASTQREAPGVRAYLWNVRRRVAEVWRPGVVRVPNLAETLLSGFIAPERAVRIFGERVMRRQRQVLEARAPRLGGAVDAIEAIGGVAGNGPSTRQAMPADVNEESWRRNARTTRVEVIVDQDAQGRVLDVRNTHPSGIAAFDRAALEAVRQGVEAQDPVALPGGRRSRWSFTVVATRRLFAPSIGGAFDESRGWFSVQLPGQVSLRSRVQMESSGPLDEAPASATP